MKEFKVNKDITLGVNWSWNCQMLGYAQSTRFEVFEGNIEKFQCF